MQNTILKTICSAKWNDFFFNWETTTAKYSIKKEVSWKASELSFLQTILKEDFMSLVFKTVAVIL